MAFRDFESGEGWLPPTARLVRDSGMVLFIESHRFETKSEVRAYAWGWFERAFLPSQCVLHVGQRTDLDPAQDADLLAQLEEYPEDTWIAYGVAYRFGFPPRPECDDFNNGEAYRRRLQAASHLD
jgi:hypothetical protein